MSFFDRFKLLASQAGTTVNAAAKELGISSGSVTSWKNGTEPGSSAVSKIADHFNVTTDYLLGKTDIPSPLTHDPNDEVWELRREMAERPEIKTLFSLAKTADKDTIDFANEMIKRMRKESGRTND